MKTIASIFIIFFLFSCSPVKRFNRLIEKHPELIRTDTIVKKDTIRIRVPKVEYKDTFVTNPIDTIEIEKERLKIKILRYYDTLQVSGECDTITVTKIVERKIPVKYYKENKFNWNKLIFWLIIGLVLYIAIRNYKK